MWNPMGGGEVRHPLGFCWKTLTPLRYLEFWHGLIDYYCSLEFWHLIYNRSECRPHGMCRILTPNYDKWCGFWYKYFLCQNPRVSTSPSRDHVDRFIGFMNRHKMNRIAGQTVTKVPIICLIKVWLSKFKALQKAWNVLDLIENKSIHHWVI